MTARMIRVKSPKLGAYTNELQVVQMDRVLCTFVCLFCYSSSESR